MLTTLTTKTLTPSSGWLVSASVTWPVKVPVHSGINPNSRSTVGVALCTIAPDVATTVNGDDPGGIVAPAGRVRKGDCVRGTTARVEVAGTPAGQASVARAPRSL